jgi:Multicopper oxidase
LPGGFTGANDRLTINGMQYANLPMMTMKLGDRVRWYVVTMGNGFNTHTPHWHGKCSARRREADGCDFRCVGADEDCGYGAG